MVTGPGPLIFTLGICYEAPDIDTNKVRTIDRHTLPRPVYLHGDDVPLLVRDRVLSVGVLAHHAVQAVVGHLGVAGAGEIH